MRAARRTNGPVGDRWGRLTRSALAALAVSLAVVTSLMSAVATAPAAQAIVPGLSALGAQECVVSYPNQGPCIQGSDRLRTNQTQRCAGLLRTR